VDSKLGPVGLVGTVLMIEFIAWISPIVARFVLRSLDKPGLVLGAHDPRELARDDTPRAVDQTLWQDHGRRNIVPWPGEHARDRGHRRPITGTRLVRIESVAARSETS
jgi:hypothetical protein